MNTEEKYVVREKKKALSACGKVSWLQNRYSNCWKA